MAVLPAVEAVVGALPDVDRSGWRAELALQLARSLDEFPNASMARELRSVMNELQANSLPVEVDDLDELTARREKRRSASSG